MLAKPLPTLLALTVALLLMGCGGGTAPEKSSEPIPTAPVSVDTRETAVDDGHTVDVSSKPLRVITTMSILTDFIEHVGGDRVQAENIIPLGAGPEDYQPTPQDVRKIASADIVFFNGHGLEEWLHDLFTSAGKADLKTVELSKDLQAVDVGGADFTLGNPHFWLNPVFAITYVEVIRDTLTEIDPGGAAIYRANSAAYIEQLRALDDELKAMVATIPQDERKLVTNHDAFPYFAQHYGLTIVGKILGSPEAELSAADLAGLVRTMQSEHVKAVFTESQFAPKVVETLAREAHITVIGNLYTDSLGTQEAGTYIEMMRYNMRTIAQAIMGTTPNDDR